jgi:uncharacterized protein YkvS
MEMLMPQRKGDIEAGVDGKLEQINLNFVVVDLMYLK